MLQSKSSYRISVNIILMLITISMIFLFQCSPTDSNEDDNLQNMMTTIITVHDSIQTYDCWTTGSVQTNEWAKPIYKIWIDTNGDPSDACTGNGSGPKSAEFWLDTGRLGFRWYGANHILHTADDLEYWPVQKISDTQWSENGINANISVDGKSFIIEFPLSLIGKPKTMEVSFMTSPWTTCASDNLGTGSGTSTCWIVIPDASIIYNYTRSDNPGDNYWPNLVPNKRANFDLIETKVIIK